MDPIVEYLEYLGPPFSEEEIKRAIMDLPTDKAPAPDGFTSNFFQSCWLIVKEDLVRVVKSFSELSIKNLQVINTANIALLHKKHGADCVKDLRPISLIHVIPKIIGKAIATRLRPKMNDIVSNIQSAFIKSLSIHANFMYMRNIARKLHRNHTPALRIKLNIA